MGWYYLPDLDAPSGSNVVVDGEEGRHIARVARIQLGEEITLFDGRGNAAECAVTAVRGSEVEAKVLRHRRFDPPGGPPVDVAVGVVPLDRMKRALSGVVASGIRSFAPLICERSQKGKKRAEEPGKLVEALSKTALAGCRQAECPFVPHVARPVTLDEILRRAVSEGVFPIAATTLHEAGSLEDALGAVRNHPEAAGILLLIGPEGGFSDEEYSVAQSAGAYFVRFAPYVYRTEDAACAFTAAVRTALGW